MSWPLTLAVVAAVVVGSQLGGAYMSTKAKPRWVKQLYAVVLLAIAWITRPSSGEAAVPTQPARPTVFTTRTPGSEKHHRVSLASPSGAWPSLDM